MNIIDISWPLTPETTAYKNRFVIKFENTKDFAQDKVRESTITVGSHSGTHIDAPSHFLEHGKTLDQYALNRFIGIAQVLDMTNCHESIMRQDLMFYDNCIQPGDSVLLRTKNSDLSTTDLFNPQFIYLSACGAQYLMEKKVQTIGIDYLGIERGQQGHPTHELLMNADVIIIEGLRLASVQQGRYTLVCLPLYTVGLEAAPARAILIVQ